MIKYLNTMLVQIKQYLTSKKSIVKYKEIQKEKNNKFHSSFRSPAELNKKKDK